MTTLTLQKITGTNGFLAPLTVGTDPAGGGSRFYVTPGDGTHTGPFGFATVGIGDEEAGGIVTYCHQDNAAAMIAAFRAYTGDV